MSKHKELLKHLNIQKLALTESGGLIIRFNNESHTFIDPFNLKIIIQNYENLVKDGLIVLEEE